MNARVKILFFLFLVLALATIGRLFSIQVLKADYYAGQAARQHNLEAELDAKRGSIYLRSLTGGEASFVPVALTKRAWNIWVSPKDVAQEEREELAKKLAGILEIEPAIIAERLAKENDPYEPLREKVDEGVVSKIKELNNPVLHWDQVDTRYYPLGAMAAHTVGFVSRQFDKPLGQYGLEERYDDSLSGREGYVRGVRNPLGFLIRPFSTLAKPEAGADLYLTIDYNIQLALERKLEETRQKLSASAVSGIIIEPQTGKILALGSTPAFDPNAYNTVKDVSQFVHPLTQKLFEPGSVFKPLTMAVGLDINVIAPDLTYYDEGFVQVRDAQIKNSTLKSYGTQTMTQILEKSLNTGAVFVVQKIPKGVWREYLEKFGFAEKTGIDLAGEVSGDIKNIRGGGEVEKATSAFGQGIAVTPIGLATAIGAIANGGEIIEPYLVEKAMSDGKVLFEHDKPKVIRRVVRADVAEAVKKMMVSVVENGSGRRAKILGYSVAGKTGTAQVPSPEGGYSDRVIHSFVGFAPAFNPKFIALVKIDDPQGSQFSEATAAPLFKEIAEFILHYYNIEPDQPVGKN